MYFSGHPRDNLQFDYQLDKEFYRRNIENKLTQPEGYVEWFGELNLFFNIYGSVIGDTRSEAPLQFPVSPILEWKMSFLLHKAYTYLEEVGSTVSVMFSDFCSSFNGIRLTLHRNKILYVQVDF